MTPQPQPDIDGQAIYTDLLNIEEEAADLRELEIKLQVLIAGIRQGKFNISRPAPATPEQNCHACTEGHIRPRSKPIFGCPDYTTSPSRAWGMSGGGNQMEQHEATIRKDERNQTLDEFKKWNPFKQSFDDFVESLRHTEAQQ